MQASLFFHIVPMAREIILEMVLNFPRPLWWCFQLGSLRSLRWTRFHLFWSFGVQLMNNCLELSNCHSERYRKDSCWMEDWMNLPSKLVFYPLLSTKEAMQLSVWLISQSDNAIFLLISELQPKSSLTWIPQDRLPANQCLSPNPKKKKLSQLRSKLNQGRRAHFKTLLTCCNW